MCVDDNNGCNESDLSRNISLGLIIILALIILFTCYLQYRIKYQSIEVEQLKNLPEYHKIINKPPSTYEDYYTIAKDGFELRKQSLQYGNNKS
jgi:hypothetical protein